MLGNLFVKQYLAVFNFNLKYNIRCYFINTFDVFDNLSNYLTLIIVILLY